MTIIKKMAVLIFAALIAVIFFSLRLDSSDRHYFGVDDLAVVNLVDKARFEHHWQPDWYAAVDPSQLSDKHRQASQQELARIQATHPHHYNFAAHISLSSAIAVAFEQLGWPIDTTRLLRSMALLWDSCSLLLLGWLALRLLGLQGALLAGLCYSVLPLAVQSSHYARPDALLGCQALAVICLSYRLLSIESRKQLFYYSALLGALLAFAITTKASSLLYGIFPLASFLYLLNTRPQRFSDLLWAGCLLILVLCGVITAYFAAVNIDWRDFVASVQSIQRYYQAPLPPDIRYDPSHWGHIKHFIQYLSTTLGWVWLGYALIGIGAMWTKQRALIWILVLPTLLLTGYYLSQVVFFDRSLLVLMPVLCLLGAAAIGMLSSYASKYGRLLLTTLLCLCLIWPAAQLSWTLQRHIGKSISEQRRSYQQQLLEEMRHKTEVNLWLKWVDRLDITNHQLPTLNNPQPRLYVVEHFNDPQSDAYLAYLRQQQWLQVGYYQGDFSHLPTNSLHIAHEAAHFYYFIDPQAITTFKRENSNLSK